MVEARLCSALDIMFYKNIFARGREARPGQPGMHKILKAKKLPPSEMWSLSIFANVKWVLFICNLDYVSILFLRILNGARKLDFKVVGWGGRI